MPNETTIRPSQTGMPGYERVVNEERIMYISRDSVQAEIDSLEEQLAIKRDELEQIEQLENK